MRTLRLEEDASPRRYTGKPYDAITGLYNYGHRDYQPQVARFTTVDPIRDGSNWFAYVNNDPVNWIDPQGLLPQALFGAIIGFVASSATEIGSRMVSGQSLTEAVSNTINDPVARTNILASTAMGALTAGTSALLTSGVTQAGKIATTNIIVNTIGGAADAAIKSVAGNIVTGQPQNVVDTLKQTAIGAGTAAVFSGFTEGAIVVSTTRSSQITNVVYGIETNAKLNPPAWSGIAGIVGETVIPAGLDIISTGKSSQSEKNY
jgi:RHS repeat-associated protein